ncbi:MAG: hypothetical protein ACM3TR_13435 [Caulobacteraceae bacterium]
MNHTHNNSKEHENYDMPLWFIKTRHAIYYVLSVIEVLIAFRFIFKLLGANPHNGFVAFLYSIAGVFTAPFSGIFNSFVSSGLSAKSVFEPADIIGMAVYAVLAWGLVGLIRLKTGRNGY